MNEVIRPSGRFRLFPVNIQILSFRFSIIDQLDYHIIPYKTSHQKVHHIGQGDAKYKENLDVDPNVKSLDILIITVDFHIFKICSLDMVLEDLKSLKLP